MARALVTAKLRAIVVDDEPLARDTVRLLLGRDPEIEFAGGCTGVDAPDLIRRVQPDILFLDVQMPEVDGFDVLREIGTTSAPSIIFVTAYDEYAIRAFDVDAVDYLLKPFDDVRFARALERAKENARRDPEPYVRRFLVRTRDKVVVVNAEEVDWIEAADYYVSLHVGAKTHLLRETMSDLEKRLDPEKFFRAHRSAIVNVDRIREIHPLFRGDCALVLTSGTRVRLSRTRRATFERVFASGRR